MLAAYESAAALKLEAKERRLTALDAKFTSGDINKGDLDEADTWTKKLVADCGTILQTLREKRPSFRMNCPLPWFS